MTKNGGRSSRYGRCDRVPATFKDSVNGLSSRNCEASKQRERERSGSRKWWHPHRHQHKHQHRQNGSSSSSSNGRQSAKKWKIKPERRALETRVLAGDRQARRDPLQLKQQTKVELEQSRSGFMLKSTTRILFICLFLAHPAVPPL